MRVFILLCTLCSLTNLIFGQSTVKLKMQDNQTIKGNWLGMEQDQYLVQQENGTVIYIPQDLVVKLKVYRSYQNYPRYDDNRSNLFFGWSGDLNSTIGQKSQNIKGVGMNGILGYDWDHKYSIELSAGYRNMNIGRQESFLPLSVAGKKYLTSGRYLLFTGLELGYQLGLDNQWHSPENQSWWAPWTSSRFIWDNPRHKRGHGPSIAPMVGVRKIGKYGFDHVINVGFHVQKYTTENLYEDDNYSKVDLVYKRWRVSYGMIF